MDRFRPAAGGCVFVHTGSSWALCLLPTVRPDPGRVVESLGEIPDKPEALVVFNWWDDGFFPTAAVAEAASVPDSSVYLLSATAPPDRSDRSHTQRVLSRPVRVDGGLELGKLHLERTPHAPHAVMARWTDSDRTLLIGAALPLDAWTRSTRPRHIVGTLCPPETPAEQRALEKKIEAQLFDDVRTIDLLKDVVGPASDAFLEQLAPTLKERNVRVRSFGGVAPAQYR